MPNDDRNDETQAMSPADEPTRMLDEDVTRRVEPADPDPTRLMPSDDAVTRRIDPGPRTEATPTRRIERRSTSGGPATELIAVPARRGYGWLIALVVAVAIVAGAAIGYTQHRPSDRGVVARALVGPDGGTMRFDQVGTLTVPRGALSSPTAITIRRASIDKRVRLGAANDPRAREYAPGELVVYAFEPAGLRFQQPVTIELPRNGNGSAVFVDADAGPQVIAGTPDGNVVRITTTSFAFDATSGAGAAP